MTPIQLWLPTFFGGVAQHELRRDMLRLFRARTTDDVMWSIPGWTGPPRWTQHGIRVGCLNGDHLECVRILHVGENGAVVGPAAAAFPNLTVDGLLDAWLNDEFVRLVQKHTDEPVRVEVPHPVRGGVTMVEQVLPLRAKHVLPITHAGDQQIAAQWPPRSDMPRTVSPELESAQLSSDIQKGTLPMRFAWSAPFDGLQPVVISPDDIYSRDMLRQVAENSGADPLGAHAQAATEARDWVSEGRASVNESWLQPIILADGEPGALFAIEIRFGISVGSLELAYKDAELQQRLSQSTPIRRAWGVPGLMRALLLDRLSRTQVHRTCQRCGALISGRGHKLYCSKSDNQKCFQARKAGDRRGSRARQMIGGP